MGQQGASLSKYVKHHTHTHINTEIEEGIKCIFAEIIAIYIKGTMGHVAAMQIAF